MNLRFAAVALTVCALFFSTPARALPKTGVEEVYGVSTFVTKDKRRIEFIAVHPSTEGIVSVGTEYNRAYTRQLILGASRWYLTRLQKMYPELGEEYFKKVALPEAWLDGRSSYIIAGEMVGGQFEYRGMVRFSWRSEDRPLTPSEEAFPRLNKLLPVRSGLTNLKAETELWKDLMKGSPRWESEFALNDSPYPNPGVEGGEWIEIKNLILAERETIDLLPFLLFTMERTGIGHALYSDKPMDFTNFELKVQNRYFFTCPMRLIPYYKNLGFTIDQKVSPGVWLFKSDRTQYLQQLRHRIRMRKGVGQLIEGRWETPGYFKSDNWRALTFSQERDPYLKYLPALTDFCNGGFKLQRSRKK